MGHGVEEVEKIALVESCLRRAEARMARGQGRFEPASLVLNCLGSTGRSQFYYGNKLSYSHAPGITEQSVV